MPNEAPVALFRKTIPRNPQNLVTSGFKFEPQYTMFPRMQGPSRFVGSSLIYLARKYAPMPYLDDAYSRMTMAFSRPKICTTLKAVPANWFRVRKKSSEMRSCIFSSDQQTQADDDGDAHLHHQDSPVANRLDHGPPVQQLKASEPSLLPLGKVPGADLREVGEIPPPGCHKTRRQRGHAPPHRPLFPCLGDPVSPLLAGVLQRLGSAVKADKIKEEVRRVVVGRTNVSQRLKIRFRGVAWAKVHDFALAYQQQRVNHFEDNGPWLVDHRDDAAASLRQGAQALHHAERLEAVESRRRLIEEDGHGRRDELGADVHPLPLPPADPSDLLVADDGVGDGGESQQLHDLLCQIGLELVGHVRWEREGRCREDGLADGQEGVQDIVLHHIGGALLEVVFVTDAPVQHDLPRVFKPLAVDEPAGQGVEQGRLAASRGAHDGHQLARDQVAGGLVEQRPEASVPLLQRQVKVVPRERRAGAAHHRA
eukprot:scaffold1459_cov260-Pinguiococcus_pyrenoidosus.AAC.17